MTRKSFILYTDTLSVLEKLDDAQVAKLFRAIKAYHSAEAEKFNELMTDKLIELVFEAFRIQFERDSDKYEARASRSRANGRSGGRPAKNEAVSENENENPSGLSDETQEPKKPTGFLSETQKPKKPSGFSGLQQKTQKPKKPRKPDNDNDNDNDNDSVNDIDITLPDGRVSSGEQTTQGRPQAEKKEIDYDWILKSWNSICVDLPKVKALTSDRKAKLKVRVEEMDGWEKAMPTFDTLFKKVQQSKFLRGDNKNGWRASFDWIIANGKNWLKAIEGNYDNNDNNYGKANNIANDPGKAGYNPRRGVGPCVATDEEWSAPI